MNALLTDGGGEAGSDSGSSSSDDVEDATMIIEEDAQCFLKILDRLRMRATAGPDARLPALTVAADKQKQLHEVVSLYFPSDKDRILILAGGYKLAADLWNAGNGQIAAALQHTRYYKDMSSENFQSKVADRLASQPWLVFEELYHEFSGKAIPSLWPTPRDVLLMYFVDLLRLPRGTTASAVRAEGARLATAAFQQWVADAGGDAAAVQAAIERAAEHRVSLLSIRLSRFSSSERVALAKSIVPRCG